MKDFIELLQNLGAKDIRRVDFFVIEFTLGGKRVSISSDGEVSGLSWLDIRVIDIKEE